jgi:SAM-dependent methyltransferase
MPRWLVPWSLAAGELPEWQSTCPTSSARIEWSMSVVVPVRQSGWRRRCASAIGIGPSPSSVRLGSWIDRQRRCAKVTIVRGNAEALPLPDASATVIWSLSAFHHWADQRAGLAEASRVLATHGRILIMERLVKPGARGHSLHGLMAAQLDSAADLLRAAGFIDVVQSNHTAGRTTWCMGSGTRTTP